MSDMSAPDSSDAVVRVLPIVNQKGLHARASAKFVHTVEAFQAEVRVSNGGEKVDGASILDLLMLGGGPGTTITVEATGPQAKEVIAALENLLATRFGEDE
jgi:phosphocarrier protein